MKLDTDVGRWFFVAAMGMLGMALALVVIRNPGLLRPPSPAASATPVPHRTIESPYGNGAFRRGQAHGQTNVGTGHAFAATLGSAYREAGYEWLAVTDLNAITSPALLATPGLTVVPSAGATYGFGTFLAYNVDAIPDAITPRQVVDGVQAQAGVVFVGRPLAEPAPNYDQLVSLRDVDGIEIFDARLVKDDPTHADAVALWDRLLTDGMRLWGIAGDDTIEERGPDSTIGRTSTDVQVDEVTPIKVTDALRRGAFIAGNGQAVNSVTVAGDTITVSTPDAEHIAFIGRGGEVLRTTDGPTGSYTVNYSELYVRAVAYRADGRRAWVQPVFVNP
ncbi:MAG: hypothetical protein QOE92_1033 [Chloroflexota bacterium]|nr:hypothetical protein [Chloroflexota bacterium]